ncbi:MAG: NADH-quinone oxidoreductase subunit NuoE [Desulfobacterales bacterium]
MLTAQEKKEIEVVADHYELKKAASIEALKIVQKHRGWVSDEVLNDVAEVLEMSPSDLDAVATFYNLIFRRPVGRHVILVCDSVSCWIMGYDTIANHLKERLGIDFGETTEDGRFTLLPQVCLGACDRAPVMMIDEQLYGELDAEKIDEILASFK